MEDFILAVVTILIVMVLAFFLGGLVVWLYWNFAVTAVFASAPLIGYWQACVVSLGLTMFVRGSNVGND